MHKKPGTSAPTRAHAPWARLRHAAVIPAEHWNECSELPRVLVECRDLAQLVAMERVLGNAGYEVAGCTGPSADAGCPLLAGGSCALQAGADVIVNCVGVDDREARSLVRRTRAVRAGTPLVIEVSPPDAAVNATVLAGAALLLEPWRGADLVAAVDEVVPPKGARSGG